MLAKTPITDTYLTAAELGITEAERDALIWVREELASGRIEHVEDQNAVNVGAAFNMGTWGSGCGSPACIAGWMATAAGDGSEDAQKYQYDLHTNSYCPGPLYPLYFPVGYGLRDLTPAQAVRAIDFWATGHQADCWSLALSKA